MPRVRKGEATKNVDDVLRELGVDTDLSPEEATDDFMRTNVRKAVAEPDDDEDDGDDDEDDDDDDVEEDEEEEDKAASPVKRESAFFPAVPSKPAPRLTPVQNIPDPDPEPDPLPFIAPPPPTPIKAKAKTGGSSAMNKLGKGLAGKLPGAERIKVYKRQDSGQLGHVGDYKARDLEGCVDAEDFIARYIKPKFGAGEYQLKAVDSYAREMDVGSVYLLDPPSVSEAGGAFGLAQSLMQQQREFMREQMARAAQQPAVAAQDPITMLRNVMALSDSVTQKAKEEKERGAAEMNGTMGSMMQMMMLQQQQAQAQAQQQSQQMMQMMLAAMAPREDPMMKVLLAKLLEEKTSSRGEAMPLPPPPPPPADPMDGIAKLITALAAAGLIGSNGGGGGSDDEVKAILKEQIAARESERLTFKDVIGMMQEMRQERGTDDFKKSADNLSMMLSITNQLRQSTEGGAAAGFFDALAALFGNRDFAGSIAGAIRSKASTAQQQQIVTQNQQQVMQQRALVNAAVQQRQQIAAEARRSLEQTAPQAPSAVAAPSGSVAQAAAPSAAPAVAAVQPPRQVPRLPPLPANTSDHINNIVAAKDDDASLMGACVSLLMYLSEFAEWKPFAEQLLGAAQNGNKREMIQYLAILFEGFVGMGLMEIEVAKRVLMAANQHFDVIHAKLGNDGSGGVLPEEEEEGEEDFLAEDDDEDEDEGGSGFDTAQA